VPTCCRPSSSNIQTWPMMKWQWAVGSRHRYWPASEAGRQGKFEKKTFLNGHKSKLSMRQRQQQHSSNIFGYCGAIDLIPVGKGRASGFGTLDSGFSSIRDTLKSAKYSSAASVAAGQQVAIAVLQLQLQLLLSALHNSQKFLASRACSGCSRNRRSRVVFSRT